MLVGSRRLGELVVKLSLAGATARACGACEGPVLLLLAVLKRFQSCGQLNADDNAEAPVASACA